MQPTPTHVLDVVLRAEPGTGAALERVEALRSAVAGTGAKVGGSDAELLDSRATASRDRSVLFPVILVIVLLFGAKKLPELARGSGRALRIFKAETKGLLDDEDEKQKTEEQKQIDAQRAETIRYEQPSPTSTDPASSTAPRPDER